MRSDGKGCRGAGETSPAESEKPGFKLCCAQVVTMDKLLSLSEPLSPVCA